MNELKEKYRNAVTFNADSFEKQGNMDKYRRNLTVEHIGKNPN